MLHPLQNSFTQADPTGLRRWKTLASECSCGTTWINSTTESMLSWKGSFALTHILHFLMHRDNVFEWHDLESRSWISWTERLTQLKRLQHVGWIGYHLLVAPLLFMSVKEQCRTWAVRACGRSAQAPPAFFTFLTSQLGPPVNVVPVEHTHCKNITLLDILSYALLET